MMKVNSANFRNALANMKKIDFLSFILSKKAKHVTQAQKQAKKAERKTTFAVVRR